MAKHRKYRLGRTLLFAAAIIVLFYFIGYGHKIEILNPALSGFLQQYDIAEGDNMIEKGSAASARVEGVPMILQGPELPSGCEATSAAMALNYIGIDVGKTEIADEIPKTALYNDSSGALIGGDPNSVFIGDPYSSAGYGVYHGPMYNLMKKYTTNVKDITGSSLEQLQTCIENGQPVVVWASVDMETVTDGIVWCLSNGQSYCWKSPEHCVVLVGYTDSDVIINDPMRGIVKYGKSEFSSAYSALGKQAIAVYRQ